MKRFTGSFSFVAGMMMLISVVMFIGCDKDETALSGVPSPPTGFYPENGAVVAGPKIQFVVEGSKAENKEKVRYYVYFGTERDNPFAPICNRGKVEARVSHELQTN